MQNSPHLLVPSLRSMSPLNKPAHPVMVAPTLANVSPTMRLHRTVDECACSGHHSCAASSPSPCCAIRAAPKLIAISSACCHARELQNALDNFLRAIGEPTVPPHRAEAPPPPQTNLCRRKRSIFARRPLSLAALLPGSSRPRFRYTFSRSFTAVPVAAAPPALPALPSLPFQPLAPWIFAFGNLML